MNEKSLWRPFAVDRVDERIHAKWNCNCPCTVSGFWIYYTKGVWFPFKNHLSFLSHTQPSSKVSLEASSAVDWLISTQLPLAAFHILFNFVPVHREIPRIAPTRNASNNTWWLNKSTPAVHNKRRIVIRHAENGFWLSLGTRCDYGDEQQKTYILESLIKINITIKSALSKRRVLRFR